jgi:hypothetical protein
MSTIEKITSVIPSLTSDERAKLLRELLKWIQDENAESIDENIEDFVPVDTPIESMIDSETGEFHIRFPYQVGTSNKSIWRVMKITPAAQIELYAALNESIKITHKKMGNQSTKIQ